MGAQSRTAALVLMGLLPASAGLFAAGQQALTQAERRAIHARVMDLGSPGEIPQLLARGSDDVFLPGAPAIVDVVAGADDDVLFSLVCHSQVVVVAKAGEPESFMTPSQGWVYTEWPFVLTDVIKAQAEYDLQRSRSLTVLQSGGTIRVNGRTVTAAPPHYWPDVVTGGTYLLFLGGRVTETGALRMIEGIEMGTRRPTERESRYPRLRRLQPAPFKAMILRHARASADRQHCAR